MPAWQRLQAACGGGPELAGGDVCRACVAARLQGVADAGQDSEERQAVLAILDALDTDGDAGAAAGGFFVSRSWLACVPLSRRACVFSCQDLSRVSTDAVVCGKALCQACHGTLCMVHMLLCTPCRDKLRSCTRALLSRL